MRRARALILAALLLGACGSSSDEATQTAEPQASPGSKPEITVPKGKEPTELVIEDIRKGTGAAAEEDGTVTIHYVGVAWSTGKEFDSSWDRGEPATFALGGLIKGWQEGIPGMKEGGRRQLIIPPDLAYGENPPEGIAPNETLIFVIDLIAVA